MTSRMHVLFLVVPALFAVSVVFAGPDPEKLLQRATARCQEAEAKLAEERKVRLVERKSLAAELRKAYRQLNSAQSEASKASEKLRRLEEAEFGRTMKQVNYRTKTLVRRVSEMLDLDLEPASEVEKIKTAALGELTKRLEQLQGCRHIRVKNTEVVNRAGNRKTVPVLFFGEFASIACGEKNESLGFLQETESGLVVSGPMLSGKTKLVVSRWAEGRRASIPIDIDKSIRLLELKKSGSTDSWMEAGGIFIFPILVVGATGLFLVIERVAHLARANTPPNLVSDTIAMIEDEKFKEARTRLEGLRIPTANILRAAIDTAGQSYQQRETAMESALLSEAPRLERSMSLLNAMAVVAPLLGLLGTVSGMISTFNAISTVGTGNPRLLSGGISEALLTTQAGLVIAIPLLLAHAWLSRWVERREALLERDAMTAFGIEKNSKGEDDKK